MQPVKHSPMALVLMLVFLMLSACTPTEAPTQAPTEAPTQAPTEVPTQASAQSNLIPLPISDPLDVSGDIAIGGSSTVFPLTDRIRQRFVEEGFSGDIGIDIIGTGAGFERFCVAGETDIANASRAIRDSERASCENIGRTPLEFRVGTDALAVVVSVENDFLQDATLDELVQIFSTAQNWSDIRPEYPDEPIARYTPGTDSGTFDYFVEEVFDEDEAPLLASNALQLSEDDNVLVRGIVDNPYAIGFFGFAYYQDNNDTLRSILIEGVKPTADTTEDGTYPLARPLFIYSAADIMQTKPQVAAFINYYLTHVNDEVLDVGYFPASDNALNQARSTWLEANATDN